MPRKPAPSAYLKPVVTSSRRSVVNVFGTSRARQWRQPAGGTEAGLRAAQLQHQIARQLRAAILDSDAGNLAEFARRYDRLSYDRLRGIMKGDVWMRLEDVAEIAHLLDLVVKVSLENVS